ncbi:MAG: two-component system response regulator [Desulfobacterales bacterium]|jgi:putative two-component system response regulator|nr:two-component system response regulator [Desulfobacterales bacterium]
MNKQNKKATIMLVDDTPANLHLLENMLQSRGYKIVEFPNGEMALRAIAKNPPDLILLDILMPEMDGFEVCRRLKADEKLKDIPVLFISAMDDTINKVKAFSQGGVDYVTKPFQEEEILARLTTHLSLRWAQQELKKQNLYLEDLVREKVKEISDSQLSTILAISKLAEYRDDETGQHIERTRIFCKILAQELQKNKRYAKIITDMFIENIFHASPLHDIGKVGIPDHILLKPGKLTPEEFDIMKTHTTIGAKTLQNVRDRYPQNAFINMGIDIARSHHEKWDGTGYPDGLAGEEIPLSGRILAIADVYDALRSKRPYKNPVSHEKSCALIREGTGKHFDPAVVGAFLSIESEFCEPIVQHLDT